MDDISDTFLVMNGDLLTTLDYSSLIKSHLGAEASATIGVFPREVKIDFGVLDISDEGELVKYREKPRYEYMVSMGVNAFDKSILEFVPDREYLDIPTLMMNLKNAGRKVHTFRSDCEWLDIGRPDDYENAVVEFERAREKYLPSV